MMIRWNGLRSVRYRPPWAVMVAAHSRVTSWSRTVSRYRVRIFTPRRRASESRRTARSISSRDLGPPGCADRISSRAPATTSWMHAFAAAPSGRNTDPAEEPAARSNMPVSWSSTTGARARTCIRSATWASSRS
jgi:hypothetical protein